MGTSQQVKRVLACGALLLACTLATTSASCDESSDPRCKACNDGGDIEFAHKLPRRNQNMQAVSSNPGSYEWFDCDASGDCELVSSVSDFDFSDSEAKSPMQWVQGIAVIGAVGAVMFVLVLWFAFCLCGCRMCCHCCCHISFLSCGGGSPTRKKLLLGYATKGPNNFGYKKGQKACAYVCVFLFALLTVVWIGLGVTNGVQALTSGMKAVSQSPSQLIQVMQSTEEPVTNFVKAVAGDTIATTMLEARGVIRSNTNVTRMSQNLGFVIVEIDAIPDISEISTIVGEFSDATSSISSDLGDIEDQVDNIGAWQAEVRDAVSNASTVVVSLQATLDAAKATISGNMSSAINDLEDDVDGLNSVISSASTDLTTYRDQLPSATLKSAITVDASISLQALQAGDMEGASTTAGNNRDQLEGNLQTLQNQLAAMPNLTTTAQSLRRFNTLLESTVQGGAIDRLVSAADSANRTIQSLPTSASVNASINSLLSTINGFDFAPIRASLASINETLTDQFAPSQFDAIREKLREITRVSNIFAPLDIVIEELISFNISIIKLPDEMADVADLSADIRESLDPALEQVNSTLVDLDSAQAEVQSVNITQYLSDVSDVEFQVAGAVESIDLGQLGSDVDSVKSNSISSGPLDQAVQLNSTLTSNAIDTTFITALESFESTKQSLLGTLSSFVQNFRTHFSYGYCATSTSTSCRSNSDCSGAGPCLAVGQHRCTDDTTVVCTDGGAACSTGQCAADNSSALALETAVTNMNGPDPSSSLSSVDGVKSDADAIDFGTLSSDVTSISNDIDSIDFSSIQGDLDEATSSLEEFDPSETSSTFEDLRAQLDTVPYASVQADLDDLGDTVDDTKSTQRKNAQDAKDLLDALVQLLDEDMDTYVTRLRDLDVINSQSGLAGVIEEVLTVIEDMVNNLVDSSPLFNDSISVVQEYADAKQHIADFYSAANARRGAAYTFGRAVLPNDTMDASDPGVALTLDRVDKDVNGNKYPDDKWCLTDDCISASIDFYNKQPLSDSMDVPISLSRESIQSLFYVFPGLLVLLAVWAMTCPLCCCNRKPQWQAAPASCLAGWTLTCAPFIFLVAGALFVIVVVFADACAGGVNVGHQYVVGSAPKLCADLDGEWNADTGMCRLEPTDEYNIVIDLDIGGLYTNLLGNCNGGDAIGPIFDQVADATETIPLNETESFLSGNDSDLALREPMKDVMRNASEAIGTATAALLRDLGSSLGCRALNPAMVALLDTMCCELGNALFWSIGSWYLIAWTAITCGCCGGLLGRKRFPKHIWGRAYEKELAAAAAQQMDEDAAQQAAYAGQTWDNNEAGDGMQTTQYPPPDDGYATYNPSIELPAAHNAPAVEVVDYGNNHPDQAKSGQVYPAEY